jgi:uncharacterized protein YbjT (DUF2867 family)
MTVLVTGATGRVGGAVVDLLVDAGVPVRALTRTAEPAALPADVAAVAARTLSEDGHAGRDYVLTGPESLSQAEQVRIIGDVLGHRTRFEELSPEEFRRETEGSWPRPIVDMLLSAWAATVGHPAYVSTAVLDILGSVRPFRQWVADNPTAFVD